MKGIVLKKNANLFTIECNDKIFTLHPSGKTKMGGVFVGDFVEFENSITKVYPRKNLFIRPPLANLKKLFIVISPIPKPDFVLVDKMLIYCALNDVEPLIVINKKEIADDEFIENVKEDYKFYNILLTSAKENDVEQIIDSIEGICAFAGQSAVGKSSIINSIFSENIALIGDLSKKIERGKQTTRIVELFKINNGYIADTAGFSMLDLNMVSSLEKRELSSYYPDFLTGRQLCKYRSCLHQNGECGVIQLVSEGKISQRRYQNYLKILSELKD